jgi:hypothetical protein
MEVLEIYEDNWLNGRGKNGDDFWEDSRLLNSNLQQFCCLGLYLRKNCGMSLKALKNKSSPADITVEIPSRARWLLAKNYIQNSNVGILLMEINDSQKVLQQKKRIQRIFKKQEIKVVFKKGADSDLPKPKGPAR